MHVHTRFSTDSDAVMEESVKKAIEIGLERIAFTEHMDLDFPEKYREGVRSYFTEESKKIHSDYDSVPIFTFDIEGYFKEVTRLQKKYEGKIQIIPAMEMGLRAGRDDLNREYDRLKKEYPFLFTLGSIHLVDDNDPFYPEVWGTDPDAFMKRYYENMLDAVSAYKGFSSLAHIDYAARYVPENLIDCTKAEFFHSNYRKNKDLIDRILKTIIKNDIALEINTRCLFVGYGHVHPCEDTIQSYLKLGGKKFTYGSDAHYTEHVGRGIVGNNELPQ